MKEELKYKAKIETKVEVFELRIWFMGLSYKEWKIELAIKIKHETLKGLQYKLRILKNFWFPRAKWYLTLDKQLLDS